MAELLNDPVLFFPDAVVLFEVPSCLLSRRCMVGSSILRDCRKPKVEGHNHTGPGMIRVGYPRL